MRLTSSSWERIGTVVLRRAWTIPAFIVMAVLATLLLPVILFAVLIVDVVRYATRRLPFPVVRMALFGWWYLVSEVAALVAILGVGLVTGFGLWRSAFISWTFGLQTWWAHQLFAGFVFLFGVKFEAEGEEHITPGPILLFMRHASLADVLLPNVLVTRRRGIRLRYVLKRELLFAPAIDIAGNRLLNYFVIRGSGNAGEQIDRVAALAEALSPREGVIIYPEGTRFSDKKRTRVLGSLQRRDPALAERAQRLAHTLPPQVGGPLALLDRRPETDVVFLAHVGLDGLAEVKDLYSGGLVGITVKVEFWRVPHTEIPATREGRIDWLFTQWDRMDAWVGENKAAG